MMLIQDESVLIRNHVAVVSDNVYALTPFAHTTYDQIIE